MDEDDEDEEEEGAGASAFTPRREEESFEASVLREAVRELRELRERGASASEGAARAPSSEWSAPTERARWSKVKKALRPTQAALGYDWCFYKMQQFTSEAAAQRYMDTKPVPYVQRGSKKYIVDHHHTLAALELSGFDVEITLEQVRSFDKTEQTLEGFWGYMEGRGWAFLRDENYNRIPIAKLPKTFNLSAFRNDVYRSMGGFARVFDVLKRGKELDDRLFFEFRWGYFFWIHRKGTRAPGARQPTSGARAHSRATSPARNRCVRALAGQAPAARLPAVRTAGVRDRLAGVFARRVRREGVERQRYHLPLPAGAALPVLQAGPSF